MADWKNRWSVTFPASKGEGLSPLGMSEDTVIAELSGKDIAEQEEKQLMLKNKVAWSIALGAGQALPMNAFMMWMSGDQVGLWSIMMVGYMCWGPIQNVVATNKKFEHLVSEDDESDFTMQKLSFFGLNLLGLAMAVYKLRNLGLIPSTSSDWLEFMDNPESVEYSSGGYLF